MLMLFVFNRIVRSLAIFLLIAISLFGLSCGKSVHEEKLPWTAWDTRFTENAVEKFVLTLDGVDRILEQSTFNFYEREKILILTMVFALEVESKKEFLSGSLERETMTYFFGKNETSAKVIIARANMEELLFQVVFEENKKVGSLLLKKFSTESKNHLLFHFSIR